MSYVLEFAPDARADRQELSIPLQELVLDELDSLLLAPAPNERASKVYDLVQAQGDSVEYVFIRVF